MSEWTSEWSSTYIWVLVDLAHSVMVTKVRATATMRDMRTTTASRQR